MPADRPQPESPAGRIAVGRINTTWGLNGHVKVTPFSSNPERFNEGEVLLIRGRPRRVIDVRRPKGYPCVRFEGFESATAAAALQGELIEIDAAALPELPDGEHYIHDLVGLRVETASGELVGELAEVLKTGANDVYVVRRAGQRDALIPTIADVVLEVDVVGGRITIEPLPGLLEL